MSADAPTDPYTLHGEPDGEDGYHVFWADEVADAIEARVADQREATDGASGGAARRDPEEPVVIKGGISVSGVPHLGNMNEVMRGYYVAEALRARGYAVRQVFTADDRDPLRSLPRTLADLEGTLVDLGDVDAGALGRNLGRPYTDVPDPFGCCDSYGAHFANLIERGARQLGVPIDVVSTTALYTSGDLDEVTRHVLANRERAREVLAPYQDKVDEDYVPFNPICANCGKVTETVLSVDVEGDTVEYECTDLEAGERTIEGCGHRGTATLREGKLPWRFEWPAQWQVLGVDHEPFGKDHAEGSWPSGEDVARNVLGIDPPVPMVYEWFTLDGEAFSSSAGNVVLVGEVLELVEPETLRYFFAKDPSKARDFSIADLDGLADEFDRFERAHYGDGGEAVDERTRALAERAYPDVIRPTLAALAGDDPAAAADRDQPLRIPGDPPWTRTVGEDEREAVDGLLEAFRDRVRIPYTFAAVLGMSDDPGVRANIAEHEGHLSPDAPAWARTFGLARVDLARTWARRTDNEFNYELKRAELPGVEFDEATEAALDELADFVAEGHDGEAIQGEIYETAKRHGVGIGDLFAAGYRLFFDQEEGPQLGHFLAKLDRDFVVRRLRREG